MDFSDPTFIAVVALAVLLVGVLVWLVRLELKWRTLFRGKKAENLEGALLAIGKHLEDTARIEEALQTKTASLDDRMKKAVCGIGTVRFNPFKGTSGSNQSFATALLDESGDGVVLSSIYSREHVSVFAKPIKNLSSEYGLTEEERGAIREARR